MQGIYLLLLVGAVFFCCHQGGILDGWVLVPWLDGGGVGHKIGEGGETKRHSLGFEFVEVLLELLRGRFFAEPGDVGEVVVDCQPDEGAGFKPHEIAVMVDCLAEL